MAKQGSILGVAAIGKAIARLELTLRRQMDAVEATQAQIEMFRREATRIDESQNKVTSVK